MRTVIYTVTLAVLVTMVIGCSGNYTQYFDEAGLALEHGRKLMALGQYTEAAKNFQKGLSLNEAAETIVFRELNSVYEQTKKSQGIPELVSPETSVPTVVKSPVFPQSTNRHIHALVLKMGHLTSQKDALTQELQRVAVIIRQDAPKAKPQVNP